MNNVKTTNSDYSPLLELSINKKLNEFLDSVDQTRVLEVLDNVRAAGFGSSGEYGFYCKKCGGGWTFETKEISQIFTKLHNYLGCDMLTKIGVDGVSRSKRGGNIKYDYIPTLKERLSNDNA